jgi:hypothetical protein
MDSDGGSSEAPGTPEAPAAAPGEKPAEIPPSLGQVLNYDLQAYVPVPTEGAPPVRDIITSRMDMAVTAVWKVWNGSGFEVFAGDAFALGAVYQADITATVKEGYSFNPAVSFKYYPEDAVNGLSDDTAAGDAGRTLKRSVTADYKATAAPIPITAVVLTDLVPKPVTGGTPVTSFIEGTYSGTVTWKETAGNAEHSGIFRAGTGYTAEVTLIPGPGRVFPPSVTVTHGSLSVASFTGEPRSGAIAFVSTVEGTEITSINLTSLVPKPVSGGTPVRSFSTSQYSGTVKWNPDDSVFKVGTSYTGTVTLDPVSGYIFSANLDARYDGAGSVLVTHEYDLSVHVPVPVKNTVLSPEGLEKWVDCSTDKWTIKVYWRGWQANGSYEDGWWGGTVTSFTGDVYGAVIILTADKGYPFDEGVDFMYPTYAPNDGTGPVRAYYKFGTGNGAGYYDWLFLNKGTHTSPPPKYDTAPFQLYYSGGHPVSISTLNPGPDKDRERERYVIVGFNTQDDYPVPVSPPSGAPANGPRVAVVGFQPTAIPSNLDYGSATFAQGMAMIAAAKKAGAGYLSLKLDERTAVNTGTSGNPDTSGFVTFSTADHPPTVVIDGGSRVVSGTNYNGSFITVESGVTLTLKNITFREGSPYGTYYPFVRVASGGLLILEDGVVISGRTNESSNGGGVYVADGGTLIMKGGTISGNSASTGNGGGVYVESGGTFTMQGGTISGNNSGSNGGGVYVADGGTFRKNGGTIYDSDAPLPTLKNTANGGNADNGDAVYYAADTGYYCDDTLNTTDSISTDAGKLPSAGTEFNWTKKP